jgi:GDPmannose 4,6-dehydratase
VDFLQSDPRKARQELKWEPRVFFKDLIHLMVDADMERIGLVSPGEGRRILAATHGKWHQWDDQMITMDA